MTASFPHVSFALPGEWAAVPLDDDVRVARALALLDEAGTGADVDDVRRQLEDLAAAGGDHLYLRLEAEAPTLVLLAWQAAPDAADLRAALGPLADSPGFAEVPRGDTYTAARAEPGLPEGAAFCASYWVRHPFSGRVLALSVVVYGEGAAERHREVYDLLAARVTWTDLAQPAAS